MDGDLIPVVSKVKTPLRRFIDKFETPRLWPLFRDRGVGSPKHPILQMLMIRTRLTSAFTKALGTLD